MADILNNMIPVKRAGRQTVLFSNPPAIISSATVVGPMEGKGPLGPYFDMVLKDDTWGEDSWEKAERKMFEHTVRGAMGQGEPPKRRRGLPAGRRPSEPDKPPQTLRPEN